MPSIAARAGVRMVGTKKMWLTPYPRTVSAKNRAPLISGMLTSPGLARNAHLLLDARADQVLVLDEARLAFDAQLAWARQVDLDDLLDASGPSGEHGHPVAQVDRLLDVVGDEERSLARPRPDLEQLQLHELAGLGVERGERLVQQQHLRIRCQGAGQVDPLLHPAGQLGRIGLLKPVQSDQLDELTGPIARRGARQPPLQLAAV